MRTAFWLALLAVGATAHPTLFVGNDQSGTATIYEIDETSGVATPLYSASDNTAKPWGMAADNAQKVLYWNSGSTLYWSSVASLRNGNAPLGGITMTLGTESINFVGLGFNPSTGKLLGTRNIATEAVYEIDPMTGAASLIYTYNSTYDFGGIDVDPATGFLYGVSDAGVAGLYRIQLPGGPESLIANYPIGETDIDGLAIGGGNAFLVTDGNNTDQPLFHVFHLDSGTYINTISSPFTGSGTFAAAAWMDETSVPAVPEPASIALGVGALAMAWRRRVANKR